MEDMIAQFREALVSLDRIQAEGVFHGAQKEMTPIQAIEAVIVPALTQVGDAWQAGNLALSQVYMSGRLCEEMVERVLPPSDPDRKHQPRCAIVVLSDYHMLGKRIVYSVMRASGYELFDFGRMDVDDLVDRTMNEKIRILMISVLLLPSALKVKDVCKRLKEHDPSIQVIVGGAPFLFDKELWREVGAEAMGHSAADGVRIIENESILFLVEIGDGFEFVS